MNGLEGNQPSEITCFVRCVISALRGETQSGQMELVSVQLEFGAIPNEQGQRVWPGLIVSQLTLQYPGPARHKIGDRVSGLYEAICSAVEKSEGAEATSPKKLSPPKVGDKILVWMLKNQWVEDTVCLPQDSQGVLKWSSLEDHDFGSVFRGKFLLCNEGHTWKRWS